MNAVLVDSSVWISYFRGTPAERSAADTLDELLASDGVVTNEIVLTELLPAMEARGERKAANFLQAIPVLPLQVDWADVRSMQLSCLKNGVNRVGVPDLIIAQQSMRSGYPLFTLDRHFTLMSKFFPLKLV